MQLGVRNAMYNRILSILCYFGQFVCLFVCLYANLSFRASALLGNLSDEILQDVQKILRDIDRVKMKMKRRVKEVDRGVSDIPIVPSGSPHPDA